VLKLSVKYIENRVLLSFPKQLSRSKVNKKTDKSENKSKTLVSLNASPLSSSQDICQIHREKEESARGKEELIILNASPLSSSQYTC
jgi:hypothetical protein